MSYLVRSIGCISLLLSACSSPSEVDSDAKASKASDDHAIFANLKSDVPTVCEHDGIATMDTVGIIGDADVLDAPNGKRIINQKATAALHKTFYQSVDHTEVLKELCRTKGWAKVQVTEPSELAHVVGWVRTSALRQLQSDTNGARIYTEDDFSWDGKAARYKKQLTAGVNRILRENANCARVDPGTLYESGDRSKPGKPVFFITCYSGADQPFNVWFEPDDAASSKSFAAITNISRPDAIQACQQAAKVAAQNPQTVNFSTFMDVAYLSYPNGRSRLLSSFTASNAFGVKGKFNIACLFDGSQLIETNIARSED
jgi:hypothetical protein